MVLQTETSPPGYHVSGMSVAFGISHHAAEREMQKFSLQNPFQMSGLCALMKTCWMQKLLPFSEIKLKKKKKTANVFAIHAPFPVAHSSVVSRQYCHCGSLRLAKFSFHFSHLEDKVNSTWEMAGPVSPVLATTLDKKMVTWVHLLQREVRIQGILVRYRTQRREGRRR